MNEYTIDAKGQKLGRIASHIASILLGKNSPDFEKHKVANVRVEVINASKLDISEKKGTTKTYRHYTGFPGGLREQTLSEIAAKKGYAVILEKAVSGMIHNTKLKQIVLKNLIVKE